MVHYQRWINISYLFLCTLVGMFLSHVLELVWDLARLPNPTDWFVSPADGLAAVLAIVTFVVLVTNSKINTFMNEVAQELAKVTWADNRETIISAGVIAVLVGLCSLMFVGFDSLWQALLKIVYS